MPNEARAKLTLNQAIRECKELSAEIKASGLSKADFLKTEHGRKWVEREYVSDCPLCTYDDEQYQYEDEECSCCPLPGTGEVRCYRLGFEECAISTPAWFETVKNLKEVPNGN